MIMGSRDLVQKDIQHYLHKLFYSFVYCEKYRNTGITKKNKQPVSLTGLRERVEEEWKNFPIEIVQKLHKSFPWGVTSIEAKEAVASSLF